MDPRDRADEAFARARARGAFVITPDSATSPMDAASTVRIPRDMLTGAQDPETAQGQEPSWPTTDYGMVQHDQPPNPYQAQRGQSDFGSFGSHAGQQFPQY